MLGPTLTQIKLPPKWGMHDVAVIHLRTSGAFPTLHAMLPRTRSSKRSIAVLAAMLLVLCQAAFIAQACAKAGAAADMAAVVPCHSSDETHAPSPSGDHVRPGCEAPALTAEPVSVSFAALGAISAITTSLQTLHVAEDASSVSLRGQEPHCRPPPLTILHCRFLN